MKYLFGILITLGLGVAYLSYAAPCVVNAGCTGISNIPGGALLYGSSTPVNKALDILTTSTSGSVLWMSPTGFPAWTATSTLGISGGSGTVTSVNMTVPTGLLVSGNPITAAGTLAVTLDTGYVIPLQATLNALVPFSYASSTFVTYSYASSTYQVIGNYLTSVTADSPLFGNGTAASHLIFTNPGYILSSYASSTFPTFVYASSTFVTYPYASSTFSTYSYASSSFVTFPYASTTFSTYTYNSSTFPSFAYASTSFPTFTYVSSTFPSFNYASSTFSTYTYNSSTFPTFAYASSSFVTSVTGTSPITSSGGKTPAIGVSTGNLTLTSANLSFGAGDGKLVLLGTTTNITLTANPTFTNLTSSNSSTTNETVATSFFLGNIATGNCLQTGAGGLVAGTGSACGGGSGNSAWTIGNTLIFNATSSDSVLIGTSSPVTADLFVQGSGTKKPFIVASSTTGAQFMSIGANGKVSFNSSTPTNQVTVVSSNNTVDPFDVSTSTSRALIHVTAAGNVGIGTTTPNDALMIYSLNSGGLTIGGRSGITPVFKMCNDAITQPDTNFITNPHCYYSIQAQGTGGGAFIGVTASDLTTIPNQFQSIFGTSTPGAIPATLFEGDNSAGGSPVIMRDQDINAQFRNRTITLITVMGSGFTGIGSATPSALLVVQGKTASTTPLFIIATSTNTTLVKVDSRGHMGYGGTAPTLTSCNTGTVLPNSTDVAGAIIPGATQTTCTLNFATAFTNTPFCTITQAVGGAVTGLEASSTPTTLVITGTTIGGDTITYNCPGN